MNRRGDAERSVSRSARELAVMLLALSAVVVADRFARPPLEPTLAYLGVLMWMTWRGHLRPALVTIALLAVWWQWEAIPGGALSPSPFPSAGWPAWANGLFRAAGLVVICVWLHSVRKLLERERCLSRYDFVTGLPNRQGFLERLTVELGRSQRLGRPFALAYLDCDGFKELNDTQGHQAGDDVLEVIGRVFRDNLRPFDAAGRLGGDEFAILIAEADAVTTEAVIERLRAHLRVEVETRFPPVTFSMGVVTFRAPPASLEACLQQADAAMYRVKHQGKNGTLFEYFPAEARRDGAGSTQSAALGPSGSQGA